MILDQEGGVAGSLAILDYTTSTSSLTVHDLQLQVYAAAGRREGLDGRAAYRQCEARRVCKESAF